MVTIILLPSDGSKKPLFLPLVNYVDALRQIAQGFGVHIVDFWNDKQLNPNLADNYEKFFFDGLHPNDVGHKLLAEKLAETILRQSALFVVRLFVKNTYVCKNRLHFVRKNTKQKEYNVAIVTVNSK